MAIDIEDQTFSSLKDLYKMHTFYRMESSFSSACKFIGVFGIIISVTLSNIFLYDLQNSTDLKNSSSTTIAEFFGYDWYYIYNPEGSMGGCEFLWIILLQAISIFNNGALVVASFTKNRWCSLNWMIFHTMLLILKAISFYGHLETGKPTAGYYFLGSMIYILTLVLCLIIVLLTQLAWMNDEEIYKDEEKSPIKQTDMSVFDSPAPYEHNFHYCAL